MEPTNPTPPNAGDSHVSEAGPAQEAVAPAETQPNTEAAPVVQAPAVQQPDNLTVNTTSVESKVGLYTKITFASLWVIVLVAISFISTLLVASGALAEAAIFFISVAVIAAPIFYIANQKRANEIKNNPQLVDDVFLKKYLRKNLFWAIVFAAISAFVFVWTLLNTLFLNQSSGSDSTNTIISALVSALGFGSIIAFSWKQHAQTTK